MRKPFAMALALATAATLGVTSPAAAAPRDVTITVMSSSDIHGNALNWDYFKNTEFDDSAHNDVGLAKVSTMVNQIRADRGRNRTMLLDSGDTIQGTPLDYYYAKVEPITQTNETHPLAKAMNAIGYDAVTLGNHEFNYGLPLLAKWTRQMKAPVLGANAVDARTGVPAYLPFTMKSFPVQGRRPVRVGVLGLTNPGIAIWDKANVEGKLRFTDLVESARFWVPILRKLGADVVVVSAHAGDNGMSSYQGDIPVENASALVAEQVPGIDAVLFGHAHNDVPQRIVTNKATGKPVLLTEPSKWGQRLSVVDFSLTWSHNRWQVAGATSTTKNTNTVPEDPRIVSLLTAQHDKTVAYVNQPVAQSTTQMPATESRYKDTAILDYIQAVQTSVVSSAVGGDRPVLSIAAPFSRTAVFPAGQVTIRDIAGLYIYDNTLEAVTMTGAQVKDYLEYSAKYFNQTAVGAPVDPETLTNAGGEPDYNYDVLSGVTYDVDISQPVGSRIVGLAYDGAPVSPTQEFTVAVNNYRRSGGGGFPHISTAPVVYNAQVEIRQALIDYASAAGTIDESTFFVPNWRLVRAGEPVF
jgi:2',3'-cyclic-nucleotide 2'-phosphodiesterase / 3'-nucleotidase